MRYHLSIPLAHFQICSFTQSIQHILTEIYGEALPYSSV